MRIKEPMDRLAWDVENFVTHMEVIQNNDEKMFKALLRAKLQTLKVMAYAYFDTFKKLKPKKTG